MSGKSSKCDCPPTRKWRPCKIFAKLNGNHLLMDINFKPRKYQTFMSKVWFAYNNFSLWKSLVYDKWGVKNAIFIFCIFHFSKFQMATVKNLMEKSSFFIMNFEGFHEVQLCHKYFWSKYFWHGTIIRTGITCKKIPL